MGHKVSKETCLKIKNAKKGRSNGRLGYKHTQETKNKMRDARKKVRTPACFTKPELKFMGICRKYRLPFRYVGNGKFWIENINPDFVEINGKKICVEIFGGYWHSSLYGKKIPYKRTYKGRIATLKKYGWRCIVLWDNELSNEKMVLNKLGGV